MGLSPTNPTLLTAHRHHHQLHPSETAARWRPLILVASKLMTCARARAPARCVAGSLAHAMQPIPPGLGCPHSAVCAQELMARSKTSAYALPYALVAPRPAGPRCSLCFTAGPHRTDGRRPYTRLLGWQRRRATAAYRQRQSGGEVSRRAPLPAIAACLPPSLCSVWMASGKVPAGLKPYVPALAAPP